MSARSNSHFPVALFGLMLLVAPFCISQDAAPPSTPDSVTVLHATTRLVLVDVIVADKKGHFIPDLKPADFTVLEDRKTQRISAFNTHRYEPPQPLPPLQLPPNNYTNFAQQAPGNAVTVILVDALNTPLREQVYAHQGVVRFLKQLPPGQRVALFTLGDQLKLVQEFSSSSDQLIATAKALRPDQPAPFLQEAFASLSNPTSGRQPAHDGISTQASILTQEMRMRLTLASLNILARSLSGYSGRKNLLWLSGQFPFRFGPDFALNKRDGLMGLYMRELMETASLLASAQVAVYPIDITGLTSPVDIRDINVAHRLSQLDNPDDTWDKQAAMDDIAHETGGRAFYGNNAINEAMLHGLQEGSDYYTLAYTPDNRDWSGQYRKIEVKVPVSGAKLTYRRGYYAITEKEFTGDQAARLLAFAVQPTVPASTMLLLKVQVLPPDAGHKAVRIDYAVDARDVRFNQTPDLHQHAAVDFMAVAWDKDFKDAGYQTSMTSPDLSPETYRRALQTGLSDHQELELKPGSYHLRLGVIDRGTQKIGTVDVPLTIVGNETPTK